MPEAYLKPCETSKMERFAKFLQNAPLRCLIGFWIRLWTHSSKILENPKKNLYGDFSQKNTI